MIEFHMDYFVATFVLAALLGSGWIAACLLLRPLRPRLGLRYGGALLLAWVPALLNDGGLTIYSAAATLLFDALVCFAVLSLRGADDRIIAHDHERTSAPAH